MVIAYRKCISHNTHHHISHCPFYIYLCGRCSGKITFPCITGIIHAFAALMKNHFFWPNSYTLSVVCIYIVQLNGKQKYFFPISYKIPENAKSRICVENDMQIHVLSFEMDHNAKISSIFTVWLNHLKIDGNGTQN